MILDSNRYYSDSGYLELDSGFQSLGFRNSQAGLALVPYGGANLILTMVRHACRSQYNYMFIVRSTLCGIKCVINMQIFHLSAVMKVIGIWRPASLFYIGPGVSCQSVTAPCYCPYHTSRLFCYFFSFLLVSDVLCNIFHVYITLNILINPSYTTELVLQ